jgi:hypothetical protein
MSSGLLISNFLGFKFYNRSVASNEPLVIQGNEKFEITDTHYVQRNNIILKDNARLVIRDSLFEHRQNYSFEYTLEAQDNAQLIVENSLIRSSAWLNWNFRDNASLEYYHVRQTFSDIWHSFTGRAKGTITNSKFHGTLGEEATVAIENSPSTFLELVFPVGAVVDEEFPEKVTDYSFPGANDQHIGLSLLLKNSSADSWGITVNPDSVVTIRKTSPLIVTLAVGPPWDGVTAELDNLRSTFYADQTWRIENTVLRLIETTTGKWSPIVGGNNTLVIKNSELSDNAFSWGTAKLQIERSTLSFLRAKDSVGITVRDSIIKGDAVAVDNGTITLINTKVTGKVVEEGNGQVIE